MGGQGGEYETSFARRLLKPFFYILPLLNFQQNILGFPNHLPRSSQRGADCPLGCAFQRERIVISQKYFNTRFCALQRNRLREYVKDRPKWCGALLFKLPSLSPVSCVGSWDFLKTREARQERDGRTPPPVHYRDKSSRTTNLSRNQGEIHVRRGHYI